MSDSFQIILDSSRNLEFCSENTSSSFTNVLPANIALRGYDVALAGLYFHDKYDKSVAEVEKIPVPPENDEPFFNLDQNENRIHFITKTGITFVFKKKFTAFGSFITDLNAELAKWRLNTTITVEYERGKPKSSTIEYRSAEEHFLNISHSLATILGFSKSMFREGTETSDLVPDLTYFTNLKLESEFPINKAKWTTETILMEQIVNPTLDDLVAHIQECLLEAGKRLLLDPNETSSTLLIDTYTPDVIVRFSDKVSTFFGQSLNRGFQGRQVIKVPSEIFTLRKPTTASYIKADEGGKVVSCSKIFVTCSVVANNFVANKILPAVAVVDRLDGQNSYSIVPSPLLYYSVDCTDTNTIKIQLVSDQLEVIEPNQRPTMCVLHFKRRQA